MFWISIGGLVVTGIAIRYRRQMKQDARDARIMAARMKTTLGKHHCWEIREY